MRCGLALAVLVMSIAVAIPVAGAGTVDQRPPRLVQLSYGRSDQGTDLQAYAYRAEKVRLEARYRKPGRKHAKSATAGSVYKPNITDTDIKATGEARHPWSIKGDGRRQVLRLIRRELEARGRASVTVNAKSPTIGESDRVRFVIKDSKCAHDPPLYPIDCEVLPNGKHV